MTQQEQSDALAQFAGWRPEERDWYADARFSLDEVRELEEKLFPDQHETYSLKLEKVTGLTKKEDAGYSLDWSEIKFTLIHATAAQRCEALCRVLWPERFL